MSDVWPAPDALTALQARLVAGDPSAIEPFILATLRPLAEHLRRCNPRADPDAIESAAIDAVLSVVRGTAKFDPTRGPLRNFLCMDAGRDLTNAIRKEARHHRKRVPAECVELAPDRGNTTADDDSLPPFDAPDLRAGIDSLSAEDRLVFDLMRDGERHTDPFAAVMGVGHLPDAERRREVKRAKDRVIKRLQRAGRKS